MSDSIMFTQTYGRHILQTIFFFQDDSLKPAQVPSMYNLFVSKNIKKNKISTLQISIMLITRKKP